MILPFAIPVLETSRLTLREPREADLSAMADFAMSARARFVGGPYTRDQVWGGILYMIGHWALRDYGWWTMIDRGSGIIVGRCGVSFPIDFPEPELGWQIYDGFEGQGFAFEAALAARAHVRANNGLGSLISMIDSDNTRSLALAKRLGASFESMGHIKGDACQIWRHPTTMAQI